MGSTTSGGRNARKTRPLAVQWAGRWRPTLAAMVSECSLCTTSTYSTRPRSKMPRSHVSLKRSTSCCMYGNAARRKSRPRNAPRPSSTTRMPRRNLSPSCARSRKPPLSKVIMMRWVVALCSPVAWAISDTPRSACSPSKDDRICIARSTARTL